MKTSINMNVETSTALDSLPLGSFKQRVQKEKKKKEGRPSSSKIDL